MVKGSPVAGGGRRVEVAPGRLTRWLAGFAERHGGVISAQADPGRVRFSAADGAVAHCLVPFPPLPVPPSGAGPAELAAALAGHALAERRVGVLLVRLGGYAVGVFDGEALRASKTGSRLVQGRSAAGGWSQHRFARRRDKQAAEALREAADAAERVLAPRLAGLAMVVLGGDRRAVARLRADPRLAGVFALAGGPWLAVPDPRLAVLRETPRRFLAVEIRLTEPLPDGPGA